MRFLRQILLVAALLFGQAHDLLPHDHLEPHGHQAVAHAQADHHHDDAGIASDDDHHQATIGHYDRCGTCSATSYRHALVADLPRAIQFTFGSPNNHVPKERTLYRSYLPNAPPPERPSRAPPSRTA